jgi:hypothetical protein
MALASSSEPDAGPAPPRAPDSLAEAWPVAGSGMASAAPPTEAPELGYPYGPGGQVPSTPDPLPDEPHEGGQGPHAVAADPPADPLEPAHHDHKLPYEIDWSDLAGR